MNDFVDSHAPIDFDPERDEAWPMPEGGTYWPLLHTAPTWRERIGLALYRLRVRMFGIVHD